MSCLLAVGSGLWVDIDRAHHSFRDHSHAVHETLAHRIASTDAVLNSLVNLHQASKDVRTSDDSVFLTGLFESYEHIHAVSKITRVSRQDRNAFEAEQQHAGFPQFQISTLGSDGKLSRTAERDQYFPIDFIDPFEPEFVQLLGLDIETHTDLRDALHQAIDSGGIVASAPFDFLEGGQGYVLFKAIYRGHEVPETQQGRRNQVSSLIAFHLNTDTFIRDLIPAMPRHHVELKNLASISEGRNGQIFNKSALRDTSFPNNFLPVTHVEHVLSGHASRISLSMTSYPSIADHLSWLELILLSAAVIGNVSFIWVMINRRAAHQRAREAENRLRISENRFRDFADSSSDWFWEMDRNLRFSYFSENLTNLLGVLPETLLGKTREEIEIFGVDENVLKKNLADLKAHRSFREFKTARTLDNGNVIYLSIDGKAMFDEDGQFEGYRGTGSDITNRQQNEMALQRAKDELELRVAERTNELRESAAQKTAILDSALDCVISIDQEGCVIEWNQSAIRTFGFSREDVMGRKLVDLIVPPDFKAAHNAGFKHYIETNEEKLIGQRIELTAIRADGEEFPVEMSISAQDRKSGKIITAYLRDLSEVKQAEERLQQAQKMEAVGQLTGGVAHDFNNLLGVILGNAEILADTLGKDNSIPRAIMNAAMRGAELTQRLLAFSRQQPLAPKVFDLAKLVAGMLDLLKRTLGATINIKTTAPTDLWLAKADPGQVENALLNLVINARDAMTTGGNLTIECANVTLDDDYITTNPEAVAGDYVMLSVSDEGEGMTSEVLARAFEPFFTTKDVGEGSGLGLSMIYGFAKQSDGHVAIYSEPGHGATVKLYLPRVDAKALEPKTSLAPSLPLGSGETILVIEDNFDLRELTVRVINKIGYKAIEAPDAACAREILLSGATVDLVLSDIVLPLGISGLEFARQIRTDFPDLKIIFMSGYPDNAIQQSGGLDAGSVLLTKPIKRIKLAEALRDALA